MLALTAACLAFQPVCGNSADPSAGNPQAVGQTPDAPQRELLVGHQTMRNERLSTRSNGQLQLLLADQGSLTLGPGSEIVVNEFAYDPRERTGNLTATLTTGVLRYVGGDISKERDVTFYLPSGAVSVRGGIILLRAGTRSGVSASGWQPDQAIFLFGDRMCLTANAQTQCTSKFDTAITSSGSGAPSAPFPVSAGTIETIMNELQGSRG